MIAHQNIYSPTTRRALSVAKELVKNCHEVSIVLPAPEGTTTLRGLQERLYGVNIFHSKFSKHDPIHLIDIPGIMVDELQRTLKLEFDIVHAFKPLISGVLGVLSRQLRRKPLIIDIDDWEGKGGWADYHPYIQGLAAEILEKTIPKHCEAVTVASKLLMTRERERAGATQKVFYITNGVDHEKFNPNIDGRYFRSLYSLGHSPTIVYSGALLKFYDVDLLINAFSRVIKACPKAKCLIGGKGPDMNRLKKLSKRLGLNNSLIFTGWIPDNQYPLFLAIADIFVVPLRDRLIHRAACPVKITEYMSMGKPVIVGKVGEAMNYIEHMRSGVLVDLADAEQLADAIIRLLQDKDLAEALGKNARRRVLERYTWSIIASKFEEVYKQLTARTFGG